MKTCTLKNQFLLISVMLALGLMLTGRVTAQTFTTLHSFTASSTNSYGAYTNSDGGYPAYNLIMSGSTLYGTAGRGRSGSGTVFALNTDGTGFTNLHYFTASSANSYGAYTNSDGGYPRGNVIISGNTLYGTTYEGGSGGSGTVFALYTDGTGFTNLYNFTALDPVSYTNSDGASANGVILSGNTLYGTAFQGGSGGFGTVFKLKTDGTGFTVLHSYICAPFPSCRTSDGAKPWGGLVVSGSTLYGTTYVGGSDGDGSVFAVSTDSTGFTNLYSFTTSGGYPRGGLILSGNTLYGTAGIVFAINTDGTGFTNLQVGAGPGLTLSGKTLYGTTETGGNAGSGTVFAINTDGTGFTNLYNFTAARTNSFGIYTNSDGFSPEAGLILWGNTLYGTASSGGNSGEGTIFSLSFRPQLSITRAGTSVVLSWPTNYAGFDYTGYVLQSTTNLVLPAWTTNLPSPAVVNGQNTVTNHITGRQQFFRLSQQ